ncbi:SulP family inorganic anion transporter [Acetohalobium arabaticum]|uniref:Sulphate transporter n=1 Tax=Acetohalobium arabaticum (strain ATCC 49924 / DSM 5501 / Z-7288) TaxID=574087 RepID=D9QV97_ACEAZ|nr:SulP family inorganic anion transporter [Acetohalobium arabaticum]ADL12156.1 sulphate transporter [Acetohalobium arabaticum DSM 5501]
MFQNFIKMTKGYGLTDLRDDLLAGLSVATIALPQNMAYALIVGVDPVYGLYTSIVSMIVATFVGVSNYMVVGPANMIALAIASSLAAFEGINYLQGVLLLTMMVGLIQIILGVLKLGDLVKYVSHSVIVGLTTGVALMIGIGQLGSFLGVAVESSTNIFITVYRLGINLDQLNYYSVAIGSLAMIIIIISKQIDSRLPSYLLAVVVSMLVTYFFNLDQELKVINQFSSSLPSFSPVKFDLTLVRQLFISALSIAILGFIQVVSIVKSLEKETGQEVDLNREFIGQGIINTVCSFFSSFAISGSFTNSFANYEAGAKTRFSELIIALVMLLFILLLNSLVEYIPVAALAAIVIIVAYNMIDITEIVKTFRTTKYDAVVLSTTLLTTILAPRLDYAIYLGVLISTIIVLKDTSDINYSHISYEQEKSKFVDQDFEEVKNDELIVINLAGNLNFNTSENLKEELDESFQENKIFVIRTRDVESIDFTTIRELDNFIDRVQRYGGEVMICGLGDDIFDPLEESGVIDKVNRSNVFKADDYIFSSTQEAINEAEDRQN